MLAACGSGGGNRGAFSGGSTPSGAALVRTGLFAFVSIDSDTGSGQWQQLDELAGFRDNGGPGERSEYHRGYYGAFVLDPDG